ncbi:MAG: glycosyltransferase family 4 protein [Pseudorhodobacter sp.]|nr:glycosyltransferase family 4 protein [Pseudorhodobacter sp.]
MVELKIIHFTTVHPRSDIRIRAKEVATLARVWPGAVALFVQDGKGDETDARDGFVIHDTGAPQRGRLRRMTVGAWRMYRAVRRARPGIAHFHDPELLPWAMLLRLSGIQIIYDVHEDVPAAIQSKTYIGPWLRKPVAALMSVVEAGVARLAAAVIPATPAIGENFASTKSTLVQNFPLLAELQVEGSAPDARAAPHFAYVGGISRIRSAVEMVQAVAMIKRDDVRLQVAGGFAPSLGAQLEQMPGWQRVVFHGWADRSKVAKILAACRAGLVLFHPEPNHVRAQPNKMFEYMAAGLPVIASDFPLWREIVEGAGCGLLVDPQDPQAIARAMQWVLGHPEEAAAMGRRGRAAVEDRYNWEAESKKLVALYRRLLPDT